MEAEKKNKEKVREFKRRLDLYWQFIAVYGVALVIYSLFRGFILDDNLHLEIVDPLGILFSVFIFITLISVLYQEVKKRSIIVYEDSLILKSRFKEKKYEKQDIIRIAISKDRRIRVKRPVRIIKIRLRGRRFPLRIRPSAYWNDKELVNALIKLKKNIKKTKAD